MKKFVKSAGVAELVDAPDLGSGGVIPVGVQVPPPAYRNIQTFKNFLKDLPL